MRLSTATAFDRPTSLMAKLSAQADSLQTQIATGKKLSAPSSDAIAYQRLDVLKRTGANETADASNIKLAQGILAQTDTTLSSIETQLQRVQEIAVLAGNGTLNDESRAGLVTSLEAIMEDLLALANTKDVRGQPIFGGQQGAEAYVRGEDGTIAYAGTGEPAAIPIGASQSVQTGIPGPRAFGGSPDMFAAVQGLMTALSNGAAPSQEVTQAVNSAVSQVAGTRASVGARAARVDLEAARLETTALAREESRSQVEDVDVPTAVAELQKTLTILQATQASFTKLSSLSLFDYLR